MADSTLYVTIPKERVAGILTRENSNYFLKDESGDNIQVDKSIPRGFPSCDKSTTLPYFAHPVGFAR